MALPTYHTHKDPYPATLNHPNAIQLESRADWPKSYRYNPNHVATQGIHPPGPTVNYQQYGQQPSAQSWYQQYYYGGQQAQVQGGYYVDGQYYPASAAAVPGMPSAYPTASCPATMVSQAAQAAAVNAALAAMPQAPSYFVGQTPAEVAMQQAYFAQMYPGMTMAQQLAQWPKPAPTQAVPYKPADGQQFWCKETDGSWTLRTHSDIINAEVSPGHWERHQTSGYMYWVRDG